MPATCHVHHILLINNCNTDNDKDSVVASLIWPESNEPIVFCLLLKINEINGMGIHIEVSAGIYFFVVSRLIFICLQIAVAFIYFSDNLKVQHYLSLPVNHYFYMLGSKFNM
jgi:hypothetical protein